MMWLVVMIHKAWESFMIFVRTLWSFESYLTLYMLFLECYLLEQGILLLIC